MRKFVFALVVLGGMVAHVAQRAADERRHASDASNELLYLPSPATYRLVTMGYHEPVADLLWVRAVLLFGERYGNDPDPAWGDWLVGMVRAISVLDPSWRTPYFYGGTMLRGIGAIDGSDEVFEAAIAALPDDSFFPFALGMNHYLHRGDVETAIHWIAIAAEKPDAPVWYRVASAGLLAKEDMAPVAIDFLEEQRDATDDPAILALIDGRLARLRHDVLEKAFVRIRGEFRQRYGRDVTDPAELEVMRGPLPPDPYERGWILAADGVIRSAQREEELSAKAREAERELLMRK